MRETTVPAVAHLSPSGLASWNQCPDKWWHQYVDQWPQPPASEAMIRGTIVHKAVEILFPVGPVVRPAISEANEVLSRTLDVEVAKASPESLTSDPTEFWESCSRSLRSAIERLSNLDEIIHSEVEIRGAWSPIDFYGFADIVARKDGLVYVIDLKTGRAPDPTSRWFQEELDKKMVQPALYHYGLLQTDGEADYFGLLFCPPDDDSALFLGKDSGPALAEHRRVASEAKEALGAGCSPGPEVSALCGWCPFVDKCAAGQAEVRRRWALNKSVGPAREALGL